jgi:hypothetical protein
MMRSAIARRRAIDSEAKSPLSGGLQFSGRVCDEGGLAAVILKLMCGSENTTKAL